MLIVVMLIPLSLSIDDGEVVDNAAAGGGGGVRRHAKATAIDSHVDQLSLIDGNPSFNHASWHP